MTINRTLAGSLESKLAADVREPGYLVELGLAGGTVRLSSRATLSWSGYTWLSWGLDVSGLSSDGGGEASGELRLDNADNTLSATILGPDGIGGRPVRVWVVYTDAPGVGDAELIFDGIANDAGINRDRVAIQLLGDRLLTLSLPVGRITPAAGFNHLTPENTVLAWDSERITLEAGRG